MAEPLRVGSFCSGIAAPETAWRSLGWEPVFFSEIDPFASAVLAHRYPGVPNLGDMEAISAETLRRYPVDVVVAGTPCQSFSVAGLRGGMADARGNLALVLLRLVDVARPLWLVWENVPGVLSSNDGRDFGSFLGALGQLGYGWAYRVLDAQYFGVPQRRRRVFVVGHLGDWQRAAAVLLERHSLSGHPAPSREAGSRIAGCFTQGAHPGSYNGQDAYTGHLITGTVSSNGDAHSGFRDERGLVTHSLRADGFDSSEDGTGRGTPLVTIPINTQVALRHQALGKATGMGVGDAADPAFTLQREHHHAVAYTVSSANSCKVENHARETGTVRRLMPIECERLQGFPDNWTLIPYRGKPAADGPRYRAIGNSMAVPVLLWIGRRIVEAASPPRSAALVAAAREGEPHE